MATTSLQAQTKSRLEMGRSASASRPITLKATLPGATTSLFSGAGSLNRGLSNPTAGSPLNRFKLSQSTGTAVRPTATEAPATQTAETRTVARDENENLRTDKNENKLYASDKIVASNAYPNPVVSDYFDIDYQFLTPGVEAKLVLMSILSTPVAEYTLDQNDRRIRINTHSLSNGLYYYQLMLDGRSVATKKVLIRRQ
ncbi:T9SS type A sorting domain-containing protein [Arsenicibacter rosenii]|nr:T9SS type A sorting domain-containing protein [Arsenicibacter rosenii]